MSDLDDSDIPDVIKQVDSQEAPAEPTQEPAPVPMRQPSEFAGSDTAKTINEILGSLTGEPELVRKVKLGESACATLESAGGDSTVPPHYWLVGGLAVLGVVLLWKRTHPPEDEEEGAASNTASLDWTTTGDGASI